MNENFTGNWIQLKGKLKEWWSKLTDEDLATVNNKRENLTGVIQKRYGYSKDRADKEINRRLSDWRQERKALLSK